MGKLLLMSVIFATILIPAWAVRGANPRRGLVLTIRYMVVFCVLYMLAYRFIWLKLG